MRPFFTILRTTKPFFYCLLAALFVLHLAVSSTRCNAASPLSYSVRDIAIAAEGENASEAQKKAVSQGKKQAVTSFFAQNLPQGAKAPTLSPAAIEGLIENVTITNERITDKRYHATLHATLRKSQIDQILAPSTPALSTAPKTQTSTASITSLRLIAPTGSLQEWSAISQILQGFPDLTFTLHRISTTEAELHLPYQGSIEQLNTRLSTKGLLVHDNKGQLLLIRKGSEHAL